MRKLNSSETDKNSNGILGKIGDGAAIQIYKQINLALTSYILYTYTFGLIDTHEV